MILPPLMVTGCTVLAVNHAHSLNLMYYSSNKTPLEWQKSSEK